MTATEIELAARVEAAANELEKAIASARVAGLRVDFDLREVELLGPLDDMRQTYFRARVWKRVQP